MSKSPARSAVPLLSVMMFLQFFTWGAWFASIGQALGANGLGPSAGDAYASAPLGAIFAPLFLGIIADRFFPSQIVMGVLFLLGGAIMWLAGNAAAAGNAELLGALFLGHMLCYMPTLGLGNTIVFTHLDRLQFPKVRVWGTIGWIAAGLAVGFLGWTSSLKIFQLAAGAAILLGIFSFVLPHTPPPAKGEKLDIRAVFMLDAWKLLARPGFLVFILCSGLICIPLAYYFGVTAQYLTTAGYEEAASFMTIGQMSEIFFMLLIPFFFRRLGVKWMILVGMLAWVARYLLFAFGAPDQVAWMLFAGVALHGICYDFFFVTGFIYTDSIAPKKIRSQAQSMLVFITQGLGMFIGYGVVFGKWGIAGQFSKVNKYEELNTVITSTRSTEELSFGEKLTKLFAVDMPDSVDPTLLSTTMEQWKAFWLFPALLAAIIAVIFFVAFWDKTKVTADE
ncbi:MAG: MFS transporter [Verrucomicrobiales bacterium]|nr:MFS transporter [Verrucomicrobiales bacterium]MDP4938762.1 MFS transporter [Verrucomicrobiales bacterium]MDP5005759.1 MFS transporter [Verrucomicrobiales bacterium]